MKKTTLLLCLLFFGVAFGKPSDNFTENFYPKALRMDYSHCGDHVSEYYFLKEFIEEPFWSGGYVNLIQDKDYGNHMLRVYDKESGNLLFSRGFNSLFNEWQSTDEAKQVDRSYPEALVMPFPKRIVRIELASRDKQNGWVKKFECQFNPASYFVRKTTPTDVVYDVLYSGSSDKKVDIVFLSEGYTDREKFQADCERFANELFKVEPFQSRKNEFNIRGVWRASVDNGVTIPGEHMWRNTSLNSNYYTFDSERYLTVANQQTVCDMASNVPYDVIYILADSKKYGGGGIYNFYGISAAGDPRFGGKVFVHEFAHLFGGLGDEYVGTTSYDGLYSSKAEPWEENLTTLINFDKKMWRKMLPSGTKIPTVSNQDNMSQVGVYEGGGYQQNGIYRPRIDCIMRGNVSEDFCPVCAKTLDLMIDFYTNSPNK